MPSARATAVCNASSFRSALILVCSHLSNTTILTKLGGADAVTNRFLLLAESSRCLVAGNPGPSPALDGHAGWPETRRPADRPIVINAGMGTTGTRFVDRVMGGLGLKLAHNFSPDPYAERCSEAVRGPEHCVKHCRGLPGGCTDQGAWGAADFFSDTPVPQMLSTLLATHPARSYAESHSYPVPPASTRTTAAIAGVLLSLRDPWSWRASRLAHHNQTNMEVTGGWNVPRFGCGPDRHAPPVPLSAPADAVAMDVLVYSAFAACAATTQLGPDRLLIFDVFRADDAALRCRFQRFLSGIGESGPTALHRIADRVADFDRAWDGAKVAFKVVGAGTRAANGEYHVNLTVGDPGANVNTPGNPGRDRDAVVLPAERRFYRRETLRKAHLSPDPITIHYEDGAWWWGKSYSAQGAVYTHRGAGSKVPTTGWTVVNGGKAPAPTLLVHSIELLARSSGGGGDAKGGGCST